MEVAECLSDWVKEIVRDPTHAVVKLSSASSTFTDWDGRWAPSGKRQQPRSYQARSDIGAYVQSSSKDLERAATWDWPFNAVVDIVTIVRISREDGLDCVRIGCPLAPVLARGP